MSYSVSAAQLWSRKLALQAEDISRIHKDQITGVLQTLQTIQSHQQQSDEFLQSWKQDQQQKDQTTQSLMNDIKTLNEQVSKLVNQQEENIQKLNGLERVIKELQSEVRDTSVRQALETQKSLLQAMDNQTKTLAKRIPRASTPKPAPSSNYLNRSPTRKTATRTADASQRTSRQRVRSTTKRRMIAIDFLDDDNY
ncbi:meiotic recombination protein Rec15 [Schizosaccharomyces japonicus yFS275]|uniref:Meiotic recombination protein Rec15 n=1 Tax=Schizosaccharomyces japonicus (strain yFS275 / FY16936) TaxID=402676 RepID=B6JZU8_SCHJY|nr:meiotic recombination protein Rec15 [Schizosaccharomyces japonicus yFS275]EEB06098.1 meiotic recombination protein Rec15 [Schizosaccharomyces japonicus yFS275]